MPQYALKHEGVILYGEIIRTSNSFQRKRDNANMLSFIVKVAGEDVPVKHECNVPAALFEGAPGVGKIVALVGTAGEYNGSAYFAGYRGTVCEEDDSRVLEVLVSKHAGSEPF
jgi:hypothetical protein